MTTRSLKKCKHQSTYTWLNLWFKAEFEKLDADPSYRPNFFGGSVTSSDLLKMF